MINYLVHFVHSYPPPRTAPSCPRRSASSWLSAPTSTFGCNPEIDNFDKCLFISAMFNSHTEWLNIQFIVMLMSMLPGCQIRKKYIGNRCLQDIERNCAGNVSFRYFSTGEGGERNVVHPRSNQGSRKVHCIWWEFLLEESNFASLKQNYRAKGWFGFSCANWDKQQPCKVNRCKGFSVVGSIQCPIRIHNFHWTLQPGITVS